jgi:hypothetical protein
MSVESNNVTVPVPSAVSVPANGTSSASAAPPVVVSPPIIIFNQEVWQGADVFSVNPTIGFTLVGTVTHLNATLMNSDGFVNESSNYNMQNDIITRSLYIGNTLYTVSNAEVVLTNLTDMTQIAQVNLT